MTNEQENSKSTQKKAKKQRLRGIAAFSLLIARFDLFAEIIYNS